MVVDVCIAIAIQFVDIGTAFVNVASIRDDSRKEESRVCEKC